MWLFLLRFGPRVKVFIEVLTKFACCKSQTAHADTAWKAVPMAKRPQSALPLCCTIVTMRLLSRTADRSRHINISWIDGDSNPESYTSIH